MFSRGIFSGGGSGGERVTLKDLSTGEYFHGGREFFMKDDEG